LKYSVGARTIALSVIGGALWKFTVISTRDPTGILSPGTLPEAFAESPEKITGVFKASGKEAAESFAGMLLAVIPVRASLFCP
jgi:hypothetical protein